MFSKDYKYYELDYEDVYEEDYREEPDIDAIFRVISEQPSVLIYPELLSIGKQIRLKRCYLDLTLPELGKMLQIGASTLSEMEREKRQIPRKHQKRIEWFLYEYDEYQSDSVFQSDDE